MKLLRWCKANAMPVIAVLAAAMTAVFVPPDAAYLGYYDVKTLSCLLCVLAVVGALRVRCAAWDCFLCWRRGWCRCSTPPAAR
jgi:hypothetical protein